MGNDGGLYSSGYCEEGDIPVIKLFKASSGEIIDLQGSIPSWKNNEIFMLENLSLIRVEFHDYFFGAKLN